jgi:hypothetical protein
VQVECPWVGHLPSAPSFFILNEESSTGPLGRFYVWLLEPSPCEHGLLLVIILVTDALAVTILMASCSDIILEPTEDSGVVGGWLPFQGQGHELS